jgi:chemotaxis protein CheD
MAPHKEFTVNRYYDKVFFVTVVKILPGEYFATDDATAITTLLGSCISVCLYDSNNGIGGMNHFMLPADVGRGRATDRSPRYGNNAMRLLIDKLVMLGAEPGRLEAKIFGGGRVMAGAADVGRKNVDFAKHYLKKERIRLVAEDVGDITPRKVFFFPATGRVFIKKVRDLMTAEGAV